MTKASSHRGGNGAGVRAPRVTQPDDSLGRRFRAREGPALERVERLVSGIVHARAYSAALEDRRDIVQEVMAQVWEAVSAKGFDFEGSFEAFVRIVAIRRCTDRIRSLRPEGPMNPGLPAREPGPLDRLLERERSEIVHAVIERLGEACRLMFRLHVAERRPYAEIARRLDRSEGALRVQMHHCLREARKIADEILATTSAPGTVG